MKTVELKWIEDDNHTVAKDACDTLQGLVDSGAFPDLGVKCEDDTLYITGEKEVLDRAVMKIQKAFAKYGQIMMKEAKNGTTEELRIESFDDNVQDIFNHTLAEYETFKENTKEERPNTYITTFGKFQYKFNKLKEAASKKDKKILQNILIEIDEMTESYEENKFKPKNTVNEDSLDDFTPTPRRQYSKDERRWAENIESICRFKVEFASKKLVRLFPSLKGIYRITLLNTENFSRIKPEDTLYYKIEFNSYPRDEDGNKLSEDEIKDVVVKWFYPRTMNEYKPKFLNPILIDRDGGCLVLRPTYDIPDSPKEYHESIDEDYNFFRNRYRQMTEKRASEEKKRNLSKEIFGKKFLELAQTYAGVEDLDIEVAYDKLMSDERVFELVDSTMSIEDIMDKISAGELLQ